MKNRTQITENDPVRYLFSAIGFSDSKSIRFSTLLESFNIFNVAQFTGAFCPGIPKLSQNNIKNKGVLCSAKTLVDHKRPSHTVSKLQRVLKISRKEAACIFNSFNKVRGTSQSYHFNFTWSFGGQKKFRKEESSRFWDFSPEIITANGFHIIPRYEEAGKIFDQGERGTCVANATCTLLDYKSPNQQTSRQFLYHQCKMIDGIPGKEGTYLDVAFKIISDSQFIDTGCVPENFWPYNPAQTRSKHQGPPPEKAFYCERVLSNGEVISPRNRHLVADIKYLLNYENQGKACPVVIGVPLYESFFSRSTSTTGWVTMPLPGEAIMGYHAMIIVGYDDDRNVFLVRNSWGTAWASENDKKFAGHAWIPYNYIERFGFDAQTLEYVQMEQISVSPEDRLYNNMRSTVPVRIAASNTRKERIRLQPRRSVGIMGLLIRAAVILLLWHAYSEPVKQIAQNVIEFVNSKIDTKQIQQKAQDFIDQNLLTKQN